MGFEPISEDFGPSKSLFSRNPDSWIRAARMVVGQIFGNSGPTPPSPSTNPEVAKEFGLRLKMIEEIGKMMLLKYDYLNKAIRSAVDNCMRNGVIAEEIFQRVLSVERTMEEFALLSRKHVLSSEKTQAMTAASISESKKVLDTLSKELKQIRESRNSNKGWKDSKDVAHLLDRAIILLSLAGALMDHFKLPNPLRPVPSKFCQLREDCQDLIWSEGLFAEIGKACRVLLNDFHTPGLNMEMHSDAPDFELCMIDDNFTIDLSADAVANLQGNALASSIHLQNVCLPQLKGSLSLMMPFTPIEAKVHWLHKFGGLTTSASLNHRPLLKCSTIFGIQAFAVGGSLGFDTAAGNFTNYDVGVSYCTRDISFAIATKSQFDLVNVSLIRRLSNCLELGGEYQYRVSTNEHMGRLGFCHTVDSRTAIKARINQSLEASAALVYSWTPKLTVSFCAQFGLRDILTPPRFGLSLKFGSTPDAWP